MLASLLILLIFFLFYSNSCNLTPWHSVRFFFVYTSASCDLLWVTKKTWAQKKLRPFFKLYFKALNYNSFVHAIASLELVSSSPSHSTSHSLLFRTFFCCHSPFVVLFPLFLNLLWLKDMNEEEEEAIKCCRNWTN